MSSSQLPQAPDSKPKPQGIPMWLALAVLLVLTVAVAAGIGGLWYYVHSDKLKMERQLAAAEAARIKAELATKVALQNTGLALATTHQNELLAEARSATNLLTRLLADAMQLQNDAAALKTNASGCQVALFPDLIAQARHFYENEMREVASRENIVAKLEGARRIELQLTESSGTAYEPTPEIRAAVQGFKTWAEPPRQKAAQLHQVLLTLISESKVKVTDATVTPHSLTLEAAMALLAQAETEATQRLFTQTTTAAKNQVAQIAAETESNQIVSAAERQRDEVRAKVKEDAEQQARDLALRGAQQQVENTKTQVAVQSADDEARKIQLRKQADDPLIQAKLAPFLTPGYVQIYQLGIDKKPFSYHDLQTFGALNPDANGLDRLVAIALAPNDKVRPHWILNRKFYRNHPNDLEQVKEAQQLLIELGPVLVEMKLLQP